LVYFEPQEPVELSAIVGYYEAVGTVGGDSGTDDGTITPRPDAGHGNPNATGGILSLYIYDTNSESSVMVRYKAKLDRTVYYSDFVIAQYDENVLVIDPTYYATLKLDANNNVEGLLIDGILYERKGAAGADPSGQTLDLGYNAEYLGDTYMIRVEYGDSQYFGTTGNDAINIVGYDSATKMYTVDIIVGTNSEMYKLKVLDSDGETSIEIYDTAGTKLDTLTTFEYVCHELTVGETGKNVTLPASDFQGDVYLYEVKESGWYSFTDLTDGAEIYYNLDSDAPSNKDNGTLMGSTQVMLEEGAIVGVFKGRLNSVSFTVAPAEPAAGWVEDNPLELKNGTASLNVIPGKPDPSSPWGALLPAEYYFSYTAPAAGSYRIVVSSYIHYTTGDETSYQFPYTVNGTNYGYNPDTYGWFDGTTVNTVDGMVTFAYSSFTVDSDNLNVDIVVSFTGYEPCLLTVSVSADHSGEATPLEYIKDTDASNDDSLTVNATAATGDSYYYIASTKGEDVTVTGSSAFTIKVQSGSNITAEESDGSYVATIPAGKDICFVLESATPQTLTFSQTFAKGSEGYPIEITSNTTANVFPGESVYFDLVPGTYSISSSEIQNPYAEVNVYLNAEMVYLDYFTNSATVEIKEGDLLRIEHSDSAGLTFSFIKQIELFEDDQVATWVGETTVGEDPYSITFKFDRFGAGVYNGFNVNISAGDEDGNYSCEYTNYDEVTIEVTFYLD
ncbi:MAG: hypothetical protein K2N74_02555, partial [Clostridiales bacterium]|nr:hypothetical protein [Clostridiales bacterium]